MAPVDNFRRGNVEENNNTRDSIMLLQRVIAIISIILMAIGGFVVVLGMLYRRTLRFIWYGDQAYALMISNFSILNGLLQIANAGFACFTVIWELKFPIRLGMFTSAVFTVFDICTVVMLCRQAAATYLVTEDIHRAWYVWECEGTSCKAGYLAYVLKYVAPQIMLIFFAMILKLTVVMYLRDFVVTLKARQLRIWKAMEDLRGNQDFEESQF